MWFLVERKLVMPKAQIGISLQRIVLKECTILELFEYFRFRFLWPKQEKLLNLSLDCWAKRSTEPRSLDPFEKSMKMKQLFSLQSSISLLGSLLTKLSTKPYQRAWHFGPSGFFQTLQICVRTVLVMETTWRLLAVLACGWIFMLLRGVPSRKAELCRYITCRTSTSSTQGTKRSHLLRLFE